MAIRRTPLHSLQTKRKYILWDLKTSKGKTYPSQKSALSAAKRKWKGARLEATGHYIYAYGELVASIFPTGPTPGYY